MLKITIPKPCSENWDNMNPNSLGRHCDSCAKTVVDFTAMSDDEVRHFFINNASRRVCGRFSNTQLEGITLQLPENIFLIEMPLWKQFLVASLLAFSFSLFSCEANTSGSPLIAGNLVTVIGNDTIPAKHVLGKPLKCVVKKFPDAPKVKGEAVIDQPDQQLIGEPAVTVMGDTTVPIMGKMIMTPVSDTVVFKNK